MQILTVADVPPDPNSGAAGTVFHTNVALRELGHEVDEIWADRLGPRRIRHGNLHSLIEQPRAYRREVLKAVSDRHYDAIIMSQPQAYLAAKALRKSGFGGAVINRSHGLELRVDSAVAKWHRKLRVPESRFPKSLATPVLRKLLHRHWSQVMKYVDAVVVPCEMDRSFLLRRYRAPPGFVRTIHHGVSDSMLNSPVLPMTPERQREILHVGQFAFFKGPHLVGRIMNHVFDQATDVTMTWVTSEHGCQHASELIEPRHRSRVRFLRWTTQEQLVRVYDEHGIFLFPTLCEGAAKSSLEAMARGLCVVASNNSGMRDYIKHSVSGYLCPVGDVDVFVSMTLMAAYTEDASAMSVAARQYAQQKTWDTCARQLSHLFETLVRPQGKCSLPLRESQELAWNECLSQASHNEQN